MIRTLNGQRVGSPRPCPIPFGAEGGAQRPRDREIWRGVAAAASVRRFAAGYSGDCAYRMKIAGVVRHGSNRHRYELVIRRPQHTRTD